MKQTTKIIQRIQKILIEQPEQTFLYASWKTALELGYTKEEVAQAVEQYRKAGF